MQLLRPREQEVLTLRFGLAGRERLSLTQVGKILAVSKERVRQIEERALEEAEGVGREAIRRPTKRSRFGFDASRPDPVTTAPVQSRRLGQQTIERAIKPGGTMSRCFP